jgi:SAM-dependent methyltransferase
MTQTNQAPQVSKLRLMIIGKLAEIPRTSRVKQFFRGLGFGRLMPFFINKYYSELSFQRRWVRLFAGQQAKVLEYWKRYRCFDDIERICAFDDSKMVLDVGCGISTVLHYVKGHRFGIDPLADEYLRIYQYPPGITVRKGFGEDIPFPDAHFDVVFCSNVIDHTTDPRATMDEIRRVLKVGGHLVLTVELFDERQARDLAHPHSVTKADVDVLVRGGFERLFEKTEPWMLAFDYVNGSMKVDGEQLIVVLRRTAAG